MKMKLLGFDYEIFHKEWGLGFSKCEKEINHCYDQQMKIYRATYKNVTMLRNGAIYINNGE